MNIVGMNMLYCVGPLNHFFNGDQLFETDFLPKPSKGYKILTNENKETIKQRTKTLYVIMTTP